VNPYTWQRRRPRWHNGKPFSQRQEPQNNPRRLGEQHIAAALPSQVLHLPQPVQGRAVGEFQLRQINDHAPSGGMIVVIAATASEALTASSSRAA
jgi:hypothetical protein